MCKKDQTIDRYGMFTITYLTIFWDQIMTIVFTNKKHKFWADFKYFFSRQRAPEV